MEAKENSFRDNVSGVVRSRCLAAMWCHESMATLLLCLTVRLSQSASVSKLLGRSSLAVPMAPGDELIVHAPPSRLAYSSSMASS